MFISQCKHWLILLFFAVSRKAKNAGEYPPLFSFFSAGYWNPNGGPFWRDGGIR